MHRDDILSIGQIANRTGLAVSAIRYYEDENLITPMRSPSGQRRFRRADIRRFSFIIAAQKFGLTLPEIRALLEGLPNGRTPTATDWHNISTGFRDRIVAKIEELQNLQDRLDGCIGCGCLSLDRCALYNQDDSAAQAGQGPRYLMGDAPKVPDP